MEQRDRDALVHHLQLDGIRKSYDGREIIRGMDLAIMRGEFLCLLGPSGCGKTTTLNAIAGFVELDAGSISVDGRAIHMLPPHQRNMGMVFQNYALFPHLTVTENVAFGLRLRKLAREAIAGRVASALALTHLSGYENVYPRQLSGGQQQRVALARALVIEPTVLLLDEPFSNLDAKLRAGLREEVREIQRRVGITTVFVTHDQEEALSISDRIAVINEGRIEQLGTPVEIYRHPRTPFVAGFIGDVNLVDGTYIRPESMRLVRTAPTQRALRGTIEGLSFLGARRRYSVRCEGLQTPVIVDTAGALDLALAEGDAVYVEWE